MPLKPINKIMKLKRITLLGALVVSLNSCQESTSSETRTAAEPSYYSYDGSGNLNRPTGYRTWVYVGTPVTPNDMNGGKAAFPEMHNVYIDPKSYAHWKEHGEWRDGTILVKELVDIGSKAAVSGQGYFAGEFIGLEATIKDKTQSPNEPGNWAYYSFTNAEEGTLKNSAKAFATTSCNSCHQASAAEDFVFTQYYPVLSAAKKAGANIDPEDKAARKASAKKVEKKETNQWSPTAPTPTTKFDIPLDKEALVAYLKAGDYKGFPYQETKAHPSVGPHQKQGLPVRVFMNKTIGDSLKAANDKHPVGSAMVKEMFTKTGEASGWAVMVKTQEDSDAGKGWFWYELADLDTQAKIVAHGNGVIGCYQCHSVGKDTVRSIFPLK